MKYAICVLTLLLTFLLVGCDSEAPAVAEPTVTEPVIFQTEPSTTPTQPSETKPSGTPGTGDQSNITLFVIVMAGSLLLIAVLVIAFLVSRKGKGKYSK